MAIPIFPTLLGVEWPVKKTPKWSTVKQDTSSGISLRYNMWSYPQWTYTLSFAFLRQDVAYQEFQSLVGLYNSVYGAAGKFLFNDQNDNSTTAQSIGTGDGSTTVFQLLRSFGGFIEPVFYITGWNVYINGVSTSAYTINTTDGVVTFSPAPSAGAVLTWTGTYYWYCQFDDDNLDFDQFVYNYWELKKLAFTTVKF